VSWKLYGRSRESRCRRAELEQTTEARGLPGGRDKTLRQAITDRDAMCRVVYVPAVPAPPASIGRSGDRPSLSVALMGLAATFMGLLKRYHWISYVGLAVIAYVALRMVYDGGENVFHWAREAGMI
jgi:hypothetical protein